MISKRIYSLAAVICATLLGACASVSRPAKPLSDDMFVMVHAGMTQDEVRGILGAPDETMPYPLSRTMSWAWHTYDTWGYLVDFSVTFDAGGRALSKFARRVTDGGDRGAD